MSRIIFEKYKKELKEIPSSIKNREEKAKRKKWCIDLYAKLLYLPFKDLKIKIQETHIEIHMKYKKR